MSFKLSKDIDIDFLELDPLQMNTTETSDYTAAELWLVTALHNGEEADFTAKLNNNPNPFFEGDWSEESTIRIDVLSDFIKKTNAQKPKEQILKIRGARIRGGFLHSLAGKIGLQLSQCRIVGDLTILDAELLGLDFEYCFFEGTLTVSECVCETGIYLAGVSAANGLSISRTHSGKALTIVGKPPLYESTEQIYYSRMNIDDCQFSGDILVQGLKAGYAFFNRTKSANCSIRDCEFKDLNAPKMESQSLFIDKTKINAVLDLSNCSFKSNFFVSCEQVGKPQESLAHLEEQPFGDKAILQMENTEVLGRSSFYFQSTHSTTANIRGSSFSRRASFDIASAELTFLADETSFQAETRFRFSTTDALLSFERTFFGHSAHITSGVIKSASFANARVSSAILLGERGNQKLTWHKDALLDLSGAKVGWLDLSRYDENAKDTPEWPPKLLLKGFRIEQVLQSSFSPEELRKAISSFLARDISGFAQPFTMMAKVFQDAGEERISNGLLFQSKERQKRRYLRSKRYGAWFGTYLEKTLIGYGIGAGYLRILPWMILITMIGAYAIYLDQLWSGKELVPGQSGSVVWMMMASLDHLIPIITFEKSFGDVVPSKINHFGLRSWFWLQTILGWIIGSVLGLALAGFTQKGR